MQLRVGCEWLEVLPAQLPACQAAGSSSAGCLRKWGRAARAHADNLPLPSPTRLIRRRAEFDQGKHEARLTRELVAILRPSQKVSQRASFEGPQRATADTRDSGRCGPLAWTWATRSASGTLSLQRRARFPRGYRLRSLPGTAQARRQVARHRQIGAV